MVSVTALWLPVLLSAVFVFVVSSVIHMFLRYHANEWRRLPDEDRGMAGLRALGLAPGEYAVPHAGSFEAMKGAAFLEKMRQGPVAYLTVMPSGAPSMGRSLSLWFVYCLVVGVFAAYLAGSTLPPGAHYLQVFRVAGCTAFVGYALALWQNTIWYKRAVATTLKANFDGLVYACVTAGTFGWLWPR